MQLQMGNATLPSIDTGSAALLELWDIEENDGLISDDLDSPPKFFFLTHARAMPPRVAPSDVYAQPAIPIFLIPPLT